MPYYIYIITNKRDGTLYIGITNNLARRMLEHKNKIFRGFARDYNLSKLIYFEEYDTAMDGIRREKQLKRWNRQWKIDLIESINPYWHDLCDLVE